MTAYRGDVPTRDLVPLQVFDEEALILPPRRMVDVLADLVIGGARGDIEVSGDDYRRLIDELSAFTFLTGYMPILDYGAAAKALDEGRLKLDVFGKAIAVVAVR